MEKDSKHIVKESIYALMRGESLPETLALVEVEIHGRIHKIDLKSNLSDDQIWKVLVTEFDRGSGFPTDASYKLNGRLTFGVKSEKITFPIYFSETDGMLLFRFDFLGDRGGVFVKIPEKELGNLMRNYGEELAPEKRLMHWYQMECLY